MANLLHIDASPRGERSHSRPLTKEFVERWKRIHPEDSITYRDVGRNSIPHVDESWIAACYTSPEQRTPQMWEAIEFSDELVDEFLAADIYVMGIPMYNFNVPSEFKAYIDNIIRVGRVYKFEPQDLESPYKPLVQGKKMFIITTHGAGGFAPGGRMDNLNYQAPYLKALFGFIGITDITFIAVENDDIGGQKLTDSIAAARSRISELIAA